jgi:hypothetical protein
LVYLLCEVDQLVGLKFFNFLPLDVVREKEVRSMEKSLGQKFGYVLREVGIV